MTPTHTSSLSKPGRGHRFKRWSIAASIALASLSAVFAQPSFFLTELPVPASYQPSGPLQINDQGFVAGAVANNAGQVAAIWKGGAVQVLGKLNSKSMSSLANALNAKGIVVGEGDDGDGRPLGWITSGGKLVNFYSNNGGNTHPIAINDAGDTVGGYFVKGFDTHWRGGIWKIDPKDARKSTLITLPVLPSSNPTTASAISLAFNKSMQAAGYSGNSDIGQHAVFWNNDAAHTIVDLGVFGSDWTSLAYSLNDLGQIVGQSNPPSSNRPVMWQNDAAHTAVELSLLPGHNYGSAHLINNAGTIVGFSAYDEPGTWNVSGTKIVIWSGGLAYDVQLLLAPASADWTIISIDSINNVGQMAGLAMRTGVTKAVVLNPL